MWDVKLHSTAVLIFDAIEMVGPSQEPVEEPAPEDLEIPEPGWIVFIILVNHLTMNKGVIIAIGVGIVIVAISIGAGVGLIQDTSISESPILETSEEITETEETTETEGQTTKVRISDTAGASDKVP